MKKRMLLFGSLFILSLLYACSVKKHYGTLTYFFDGIPNPVAQDSISINTGISDSAHTNKNAANPGESILLYHSPYTTGSCEQCHERDQMGKLKNPLPSLCFGCHEDFTKKYVFMHGPAAGSYCMMCHEPHKSALPELVRMEGQGLCLQCHSREDVFKNSAHTGREATDCLDCHQPHGGDKAYFLK